MSLHGECGREIEGAVGILSIPVPRARSSWHCNAFRKRPVKTQTYRLAMDASGGSHVIAPVRSQDILFRAFDLGPHSHSRAYRGGLDILEYETEDFVSVRGLCLQHGSKTKEKGNSVFWYLELTIDDFLITWWHQLHLTDPQ